jgi:hypothetical protein
MSGRALYEKRTRHAFPRLPSRETFGGEGGYAIGMLLKNSHDFFV